MKLKTNKSVPLSDEEELALTEIAGDLGSLSTSGRTLGLPSWRRLITDIAAGRYIIRRRSADPRPRVRPVETPPPPVVPDAAAPPLWWPRDEDGSVAWAAKVEGSMAEEARAMGLTEGESGFEARDEWASAPAWWPAEAVSRGELTNLLASHLALLGVPAVDGWIAAQGEWDMDGEKFVKAKGWSA